MKKEYKSLAEYIVDQITDLIVKELYGKELLINEIALMIRNIRKELNLTQTDLAFKSRIHQPVISKIERGRYKLPTLRLLNRILSSVDAKLIIGFEFIRETGVVPKA